MNRPSNLPPPNMPRHLHGHGHNVRAPHPPPMQSVAPPPHALPPMGYPTPAMAANVQQRPPRVQQQNYHTYMENSNASAGGGAPYLHHYNRSSIGGSHQAPKKYHQLNKQRAPKPAVDSQHHPQHQPHQILLQHHSYTNSPNKPEIPLNSSTNNTLIRSYKIQNESRQPLHQTQSLDSSSYAANTKKYPETVCQFEPNYQQTVVTAGAVVGTGSTESSKQDDLPNKEVEVNSLRTEENVVVTEVCPQKDEANKEPPVEAKEGKLIEDQHDDNQLTADGHKDEGADFKSSREKTPMCLVNDLARFNKISFQYRLTGENGPAHCKRFTVTLKLGDEEYMAEGLKIKEAQHLAAKEAIRKTKYKHPIPKTNRRNEDQGASRVNVTPTVELNALAMKLGLQTYYIFDPRQTPSAGQEKIAGGGGGGVAEKILPQRYRVSGGAQQLPHGSGNFGGSGGGGGTFVPNLTHNPAIMHVQQAGHHHPHHHQRGHFQHCYPVLPPHMVAATQHLNSTLFPTPCRITLIVGTQKFVGIGRTIQQAKHDAAAQAIEALKEQVDNQQKEIIEEKSSEIDNKSPISLVFEIGIKRNLPVDFKILREDGPAHMRTFTTACIVGEIVTEAEGSGKKVSKKKAAQKMLEELKKLPPVVTPVNSPTKRVKTKTTAPRKSATTHVKHMNASENKEATTVHQRGGGGESGRDKQKKRTSDSESDASNPITKLLELFQHNKEKEPVFKLITESGKEKTRQRQFVVEVSSNDASARGVGNSKKSARRNAAQNFLMSLGLDDKDKSAEAVAAEQTEKLNVEKVEDTTSIAGKAAERKTDNKKDQGAASTDRDLQKDENVLLKTAKDLPKPVEKPSSTTVIQPLAASAPSSTVATTATAAPTTAPASKTTGLYMKDKLLYLARLMGFEVDFSDYPKGNHNEFLSIVMISTNPPQICHGIGANANESQEDAASNALKILSEMGLNK